MKARAPAIQLYFRDWMSHPGLRMCEIAARGLWADMMCIMAEGTPHGYLAINGKGILPPALARRVGESLPDVEGWLAQLEEHEVYARDDSGLIYSPRMVRAEQLRQVRAAGGPKSQDNPNVPRKKDRGKVGGKDIQEGVGKDTSRPPPAVAVASASAVPPPPPRDEAQSPNGSTAQTMVSIVPAEFRPDMRSLMLLVPNVTAWTAEMRAAIEGMHGKPLTFAQLGQAVRDYLASGKAKSNPSLRSFRRYMQGVLETNETIPRANGMNGKRGGSKEYDYSKTTDRIEDVKWQT